MLFESKIYHIVRLVMRNDFISCVHLKNKEYAALSAIEITGIPHISIIDSKDKLNQVLSDYKIGFNDLLSDLHHIYRTENHKNNKISDISFELLWKSEAVDNQLYKSKIRLFFIVRAIHDNKHSAYTSVNTVIDIVNSLLLAQKYEFSQIQYSELNDVIRSIDNTKIQSILKEERIENLHNQFLPFCYAYDNFKVTDSDLSKIVSVLSKSSDCAISFQLIPTHFSSNEKAEIDKTAQVLETLGKGINEQGIGNVSFTLAEILSKKYRYYSEHKNSALFTFNIIIYSDATSADSISSTVISQLTGRIKETICLKSVSIEPSALINKDSNFYPLPWAINEILINSKRNPAVWRSGAVSKSLYRLPYIITNEEASEFFRLPIGDDKVSAGLNIYDSNKTIKNYFDNIINGGDLEIGVLKASAETNTIHLNLNDFTKHMFIAGTPGSGKTTFSVSVLDRLWHEHKIPFIIIEPAKNEYRALIHSIPELQVFTPGKEEISPLMLNPFIPPKNVKLSTYKSTLKTAFEAAVDMESPLDKIFEEAINNCYSDFKWIDYYTTDDNGEIFNISDFIRCFRETFNSIGYTGNAENIGRAGIVRMNSLMHLFDNYNTIPIEDMLSKPTVIELAAIENGNQKSLLIALILLSILSYVNSNYIGEGKLKNIILLEEAHVLFDEEVNAAQYGAHPTAIAKKLLKRMLAEIRSYGVGMIVADQSPRKVTADVIALTDIKMAFRIVESEDKRIISDSTNMSEQQLVRLSKLKPGEAFLFFNKLDEPEEIITADYRQNKNIPVTLSDASLQKYCLYWKNHLELFAPYPQCKYLKCCNECDYKRRLLAKEIARRIFIKHFRENSSDKTLLVNVIKKIQPLIFSELNGEMYTNELLQCTLLQLFRKVRYNTKIFVTEKLIEDILKYYREEKNADI